MNPKMAQSALERLAELRGKVKTEPLLKASTMPLYPQILVCENCP